MLPFPVPGAHDPRKRDSLSATQILRIRPAVAGESRLMGGLRLIAIGGGLGVLALVALWVLWFFTAQWCSLLADQVYTAPMQVVRPSPFGWNGSYLQFGDAIPGMAGLQGFNSGERLTGAHLLELSGPGPDYRQVASVEINADGRLVLVAGGRSFVLALRAGTVPTDDKPMPAFAAEAGDTAALSLERSLLGWPARFSLAGTYLSGAPTTWSRHLYYRLSWQKASGARLAMVWRCEQGYEPTNGWHNFGFAELIQVEIRPAP